jgi:DNA-binding NarL/FixJ family response regulator
MEVTHRRRAPNGWDGPGLRQPAPSPDRGQDAAPAREPLRVVIAEGHGLVRAGFRVLLERQEDMRVAGEAGTGDEAVAAAQVTRPDVVVVDFALPGDGGVEATRRILADAAPGETRVVMLMTSDDDEAVFGALGAGATGLLLKDADPADLVAAVRVVARGEALLGPALAQKVVADFLSRPERLRCTPEQLEELTAREREVVGLVACGLSNEEIAEQLVVTRATAKTHVSRSLCKLHARDRAQLVVLAYEAGLVRPGRRWPDAPDRVPATAPVLGSARPWATAPVRRGHLRPVAA